MAFASFPSIHKHLADLLTYVNPYLTRKSNWCSRRRPVAFRVKSRVPARLRRRSSVVPLRLLGPNAGKPLALLASPARPRAGLPGAACPGQGACPRHLSTPLVPLPGDPRQQPQHRHAPLRLAFREIAFALATKARNRSFWDRL